MKTIVPIISSLFLIASCYTSRGDEPEMTPKEIYNRYSEAIVQVIAGDKYGTGFIVSDKALIVTANHIVSTPDGRAYKPGITVKLFASNSAIKATPVLDKPSQESKAHDYAVLRTDPLPGRVLEMVSAKETRVGDNLTIMGFAFEQGFITPLLLSGIASTFATSPLGYVIYFQAPNNHGFSGGPVISNATGKVVGIVNNKIFGISHDLEKIRDQFMDAKTGRSGVTTANIVSGVNIGDTIISITEILDQALISGMGVAVSAEYAKQEAARAAQAK